MGEFIGSNSDVMGLKRDVNALAEYYDIVQFSRDEIEFYFHKRFRIVIWESDAFSRKTPLVDSDCVRRMFH